MNHETLYQDVVQSIKKYIMDAIAEFNEDGWVNASFIDWDEHAELHELPSGDLLGIAGCGMTNDEGTYEVVFGIAGSTQNDNGLYRLRRMMSILFGRLRPGETFVLYDSATAQPITYFQMKTPQSLAPITRAETRPFQALEFVAVIDPHAPYYG